MDITLSKTIELRVMLKGELIPLTHTHTRRDNSRHRHPQLKALWVRVKRGEAALTLHRAEEVRGQGYFLLLSRLWHMMFTHQESGQFNSINS